MPLTGSFDAIRALERSMRELALTNGRAQRDIAQAVGQQVKAVVREEFATGIGPTGPWKLTIRGRQPLASRKLSDIQTTSISGGLRFTSRVPWLGAHQEGHVFAARASGGQSLFFDKNGRLLRLGKLTKRGLRTKFVMERTARSHLVGARILPARPIYPPGALPTSWLEAIDRGAAMGMQRWRARAIGE